MGGSPGDGTSWYIKSGVNLCPQIPPKNGKCTKTLGQNMIFVWVLRGSRWIQSVKSSITVAQLLVLSSSTRHMHLEAPHGYWRQTRLVLHLSFDAGFFFRGIHVSEIHFRELSRKTCDTNSPFSAVKCALKPLIPSTTGIVLQQLSLWQHVD